jgi:uncharacterized membrane protein YqjE
MFRGISWGMSKSDRLRWEETRKVGRIRFLIVNSLLFNGSLLSAGAILVELLIWRERLNFHWIETNVVVWYLGALVGGFWQWDQNESIRRAFQTRFTEQDRVSGNMANKES